MNTDIKIQSVYLYFLPIKTRVPLKFGAEVLTSVICARVCITVVDGEGRTAQGWGETPLSVQWAWPSPAEYQARCDAMQKFCRLLAEAWVKNDREGHPIELGYAFVESELVSLLKTFNKQQAEVTEAMPWLAALVCCSAFDVAVHDAYGQILQRDVYTTYNAQFMNVDLSEFLESAENSNVSFNGKYPTDYLVDSRAEMMPAWHLVGGKDLLEENELTGDEIKDGYPVTLTDWIKRDGLTCLKVKLRGNDPDWDYNRLLQVGRISLAHKVRWLSTDFNCMVSEPAYVTEILDRLQREQPDIYELILYVEQPFPYDLENNQIDVHDVSKRKPLFMDESAHDWKFVRLGRQLGWTGVALKTCKTQTGALLSLCWARAHGMGLMVQDLTNPMLAQIPHVLLAAHAGTIMGVETNSMQFYPDASMAEAAVHPGIYRRRDGQVKLSTIQGCGFGYQLGNIKRELPEPICSFDR